MNRENPGRSTGLVLFNGVTIMKKLFLALLLIGSTVTVSATQDALQQAQTVRFRIKRTSKQFESDCHNLSSQILQRRYSKKAAVQKLQDLIDNLKKDLGSDKKQLENLLRTNNDSMVKHLLQAQITSIDLTFVSIDNMMRDLRKRI